jgi:hypothetical protein
MVAFVRAGYPQGVPETDYIPLLALLRRRFPSPVLSATSWPQTAEHPVRKPLRLKRFLSFRTGCPGPAQRVGCCPPSR